MRPNEGSIIMIKRKIEADLVRFFNDNGKYALLIDGARQVGKTFIIREFARRTYTQFIEINFIETKGAKEIFENSADVKEVLTKISTFARKEIKQGKTLVFLDEIQKCPEAVTFIKFLVEEGSCHYILSGSLLGVELKNIRSVPVGYMNEIKMYPIDFEEFVIANGESKTLLDEARKAWNEHKELDALYHERLKKLFSLYLVVGGMPAAVQKYLDTSDISAVVRVQQQIIALYKRDIAQYDENNALRIRAIYDNIPGELNKKNKRFYASSIQIGTRFEHLSDEFLWLKEAGVAIPSYCVEEPSTPLKLARKSSLFKLFSNDVGLLAAQYMDGIQLDILNGAKSINFGSVYENAVAQELTAHNIEPNYFNSKKQGELDFVIEIGGNVLPIEVKSGKDYEKHAALSNVMANESYGVREAIVFHNGNMKIKDKIIYAPIYMIMFISRIQLPEKMLYRI